MEWRKDFVNTQKSIDIDRPFSITFVKKGYKNAVREIQLVYHFNRLIVQKKLS